jgi:hypothetical protein
MIEIESQFLGHPTYKLLTTLNIKTPTFYMFLIILYYCDSTFLSKLNDSKFRNRKRGKK